MIRLLNMKQINCFLLAPYLLSTKRFSLKSARWYDLCQWISINLGYINQFQFCASPYLIFPFTSHWSLRGIKWPPLPVLTVGSRPGGLAFRIGSLEGVGPWVLVGCWVLAHSSCTHSTRDLCYWWRWMGNGRLFENTYFLFSSLYFRDCVGDWGRTSLQLKTSSLW